MEDELMDVIVDTIAATRDELVARVIALEKRVAELEGSSGGEKEISPETLIAGLLEHPQ